MTSAVAFLVNAFVRYNARPAGLNLNWKTNYIYSAKNSEAWVRPVLPMGITEAPGWLAASPSLTWVSYSMSLTRSFDP